MDELTDFCKHLSKKEALGELSSVSSHEDGMSENEDTLAFHHPFLVKEKAPIVMNIRVRHLFVILFRNSRAISTCLKNLSK